MMKEQLGNIKEELEEIEKIEGENISETEFTVCGGINTILCCH